MICIMAMHRKKYDKWPASDLIVSDGAYGVRGFRGDTTDVSGLVEWYKPHVLAWAKAAKPSTSLCGSGTQKLVGRLFILYFLRLDGNMCNLQFGTRGLRILSGIGIPL